MPGVVFGMAREQYDAIRRTNWSTLKHMARSPLHYRARESAAELSDPDTDAKKLGRATHLAVLEPDRFLSTCVVWRGGRRYGKEWDAFCDKHQGAEILTIPEWEQCETLRRMVYEDREAKCFLEGGGSSEVSVFWRDGEHELKGRLDFLSKRMGAIVDLKTTRDASPEGFGRESWRLRYHAQAAFYVDGYEAATGERLPYVIIAVESAAPWAVQVYHVPEDVLELGRDEYRNHLNRLALCRAEQRWPGYSDDGGALVLTLPRWATAFADEDDLAGSDLVINGEAL